DGVAAGGDDQIPAGHVHGARSALALGCGALVAFSLPPWGWWPLALAGIAGFSVVADLDARDAVSQRRRFARAWWFGLGWMSLGMGWMVQLTVPGYLAAAAIFACFHGVAALLVPDGRWAVIGRPLAHALAETLRLSFPFGGVPLATLGISQVGGPLAGVARVGGVILLTWLTLQLAVLLGTLVASLVRVERRPDSLVPAVPAAGVVVIVTAMSLGVAPDGSATGRSLEVAVVQGGGDQGTRALDVPSEVVTQRHLAATASIPADVGAQLDLVLWPENTIDVDRVDGFRTSAVARRIGEEAGRLDTPLAVGLTEDMPGGRYTNAHVVVAPDGEITSRYDKVRRVPFGEYVPLRSVIERISSAVDVVGDAVAGEEPALLELPTGERLATVISWEVFFGGRAREGVELGGSAVLNPTNGASYTGTIVQTQQVASSRLRAIETGRWVVQAAPTGFSAVIDADGRVLQRTAQREQAVLFDTVELRSGDTWYTAVGDGPLIWLLVLSLAALWWPRMRDSIRSR
ncbi:MAG: apolipoprotein N-acyltransferase, partial [Actinomycetota bacterium]